MDIFRIILGVLGVIIVILSLYLKFAWRKDGWKKATMADFIMILGIGFATVGYLLPQILK